MPSSKKKVFVGLSGGVDSSVAALLLRDEGYSVTGIHIKGYNIDGCGEVDADDARRAAGRLGIPFYVWDMEEEYKKAVVDYMVEGYRSGITPNPDVICNKEIKFGLFLKKAISLGADLIATGHYVRRDKGGISLSIAEDGTKDQSYFLWTLGPDAIKKSLFPLGGLLKSEVRRIASRAGLPTAGKKDSQGVCFLGKVDMAVFLERFISRNPGPIATVEGRVIGEHKGLSFYTIGQRHLGIGKYNLGLHGSEPTLPRYVVGKDIEKNMLLVAEGDNHPALFTRNISLKDVSLCSGKKSLSLEVLARVRYRQPLAKADISAYGGKGNIVFDEALKFVAPGQSVVFYSMEGEMLGGGVII
ncbi:MAG: tRNA 2-thiouridine(34) synthase MnmA [Candidatus Colwellbacteria bacterium]|nr:tRNA 2-thiouridine(34) synthase MnmA [Candidatus Colwellbacteria bacterium]